MMPPPRFRERSGLAHIPGVALPQDVVPAFDMCRETGLFADAPMGGRGKDGGFRLPNVTETLADTIVKSRTCEQPCSHVRLLNGRHGIVPTRLFAPTWEACCSTHADRSVRCDPQWHRPPSVSSDDIRPLTATRCPCGGGQAHSVCRFPGCHPAVPCETAAGRGFFLPRCDRLMRDAENPFDPAEARTFPIRAQNSVSLRLRRSRLLGDHV